jgi:hypothetical protein
MALNFDPFEKDNQRAIQKQQEEKKPTRIKVFEKSSSKSEPVKESPISNQAIVKEANNSSVLSKLDSVPQNEVPQNEVPQNEVPQNEVPQNEVPQNEVPQNEVPQNDIPQNDRAKNTAPTSKKTVAIPARLGVSYSGFFPLDCVFFSPELFLKLNEGETKVFLYLAFLCWRYGAKFGGARASVSYLSKGTGISESTINRHLKNLIALGFIQQVNSDMRNGNIYKIINSITYPFENSRPTEKHNTSHFEVCQNDIPQNKVPQNNIPGMSKWHRRYVKMTDQVCQNDRQDLYSSKISLNSLTLANFLNPTEIVYLETRWLPFLTAEREREESGLLKLFQQKPEEARTIYQAFKIILKEQQEHKKIKSAIAVLETNYTGQYKQKAIEELSRQEQKQEQQKAKTATEQKLEAEREEESKLYFIQLKCFETAFPQVEDRKNYIRDFGRDNPNFGQFGENACTAAAIVHWAKSDGKEIVRAVRCQKEPELKEIYAALDEFDACVRQQSDGNSQAPS